MSDTPETDHLEDQLGSAAKFSHPVIWKHARQLERGRDEARQCLKEIEEYGTEEINAAIDLRRNLAQALVDLDNMQDQRDFAMKVLKRLERERDEAIELLIESSAYSNTTAQENTEKFLRNIGKWEEAK
jgi:hypothetical protein